MRRLHFAQEVEVLRLAAEGPILQYCRAIADLGLSLGGWDVSASGGELEYCRVGTADRDSVL